MATAAPITVKVDGKALRTVRVAAGYTMNLGNFESLRFEYEVTDTVREGELIDEAITRVEELVNTRLVQRIKEEDNDRHK
jgi:hypothetical protein